MVKNRKDGVEVMKLTKVAKSWEFTCTFCFKKFPSAQAMGGHQNAHRSERLEEKRLLVRDHITHRKRAFLQAINADSSLQANNINNGGETETETDFKEINHFHLDLTLKL